MKKAEEDALAAKRQLDTVLSLTDEERKELRKEQAFQKLRQDLNAANLKIHELKKELDFYRAGYHAANGRILRNLSEFKKDGFINTPEHLGRFLARCPSTAPLATDPDVRVVIEGPDGETSPVTGAWFDELTGTVRITC